MTFEEIEQRLETNGRLLFEYNALINAIPQQWKREMENNYPKATIQQEINTELGPLSKLSNKKIRDFFNKRQNHEICAVKFWKQKLDIDVKEYFALATECTKEARLRLLHFKFIHNIYPTNILLKKMGLTASETCLWCPETDFIEHASYKCTKLQNFWKNVKQLILTAHNWQLELDEKVALFGVTKTQVKDTEVRKKINYIILIAKLAISKYKYGKYKSLEMIFETERRMRFLEET